MGLVFWFGIEKLFMKSIGLNAAAIGVTATVSILINFILDIPAGMLADKWSRKGMLFVSASALGLSSLVLGLSHSLWMYLIGVVLFSIHFVCMNGTYQAMIYDLLHEKGKSAEYSKIAGKAYALFLCGAGVGNIFGGFIASSLTLSVPYFISIASCLINMFIILSLHEPTFHKSENKEKILTQLTQSSRVLISIPLLRTLMVILSLFAIVEVFKLDFGQLYLLHYVSSPALLGSLWALFAFIWALGGAVAHRLRNHLTLMIFAATLPVLVFGFVDNWISIVFFNIQIFAMGALQNQIETRVQEETPSNVRASVMSLLSSIGRAVSIPTAILLGWTINTYGIMTSAQLMALVATIIVGYWVIFSLYVMKRQTVEGSVKV